MIYPLPNKTKDSLPSAPAGYLVTPEIRSGRQQMQDEVGSLEAFKDVVLRSREFTRGRFEDGITITVRSVCEQNSSKKRRLPSFSPGDFNPFGEPIKERAYLHASVDPKLMEPLPEPDFSNRY